MHVCLCSMCMSVVCRGQKTVSEPMELEVEWLTATMWVLGTEPRSRGRTSALKRWAIPPYLFRISTLDSSLIWCLVCVLALQLGKQHGGRNWYQIQ